MSLIGIVFGGQLWDQSPGGVPIDEWACSLHAIGPEAPVLTPAITDDLALMVHNWFTDARTGVASQVSLDFVKINEVDIVSGHQITDPTNEHAYPPGSVRGTAGTNNPTTTAYRVSLDDGTRNRKARGGFYVPRPSTMAGPNGRFASQATQDHLDAAVTLLNGINNYATLDLRVGIWSRKDRSISEVRRARVSDVPDNIRRRKDDMIPAYAVNANI